MLEDGGVGVGPEMEADSGTVLCFIDGRQAIVRRGLGTAVVSTG